MTGYFRTDGLSPCRAKSGAHWTPSGGLAPDGPRLTGHLCVEPLVHWELELRVRRVCARVSACTFARATDLFLDCKFGSISTKSSNVIRHISKSKDTGNMIISVDAKKVFALNQHPLIATLGKLGTEGTYLNRIKPINGRATVNILL